MKQEQKNTENTGKQQEGSEGSEEGKGKLDRCSVRGD